MAPFVTSIQARPAAAALSTTTTTRPSRRSLTTAGEIPPPRSLLPAVHTRARSAAASSRRAMALNSGGPSASVTAAVAVEGAETKVVDVDLGDRSYPIYIGAGIMDQPGLLRQHVPGKNVLIVTNETIAPLYLERVSKALSADGTLNVHSVVLRDGEQHKSIEELQKVWDKALELRLDRNSTFVALGGGVVGDMTGFAAASYQRGVHFIQVPTTVMAMVDSSVGGKTGVNHPLGKNMIGAFYQPRCVLCDIESLDTLPDRELASGLSEVVKYGLIRDAVFFEWQEANMASLLQRDRENFIYAIERSCINKAEVVIADEREGGVRATLNLGHTFGHAMETGQGYGVWLHGEAVSAGMLMAARMSEKLGWIEPSITERARKLLADAKLPLQPPAGMSAQQFRDLMAVDKKVLDGKLRLILLKGELGGCVVTGDFDPKALDETLDEFCTEKSS